MEHCIWLKEWRLETISTMGGSDWSHWVILLLSRALFRFRLCTRFLRRGGICFDFSHVLSPSLHCCLGLDPYLYFVTLSIVLTLTVSIEQHADYSNTTTEITNNTANMSLKRINKVGERFKFLLGAGRIYCWAHRTSKRLPYCEQ